MQRLSIKHIIKDEIEGLLKQFFEADLSGVRRSIAAILRVPDVANCCSPALTNQRLGPAAEQPQLSQPLT